MKPVFRRVVWSVSAVVALSASIASAQETTTYTYDAQGRVTGVVRSGGPANGTNTTYGFDAVSNRTNVTVSNSPNGSRNVSTIVRQPV